MWQATSLAVLAALQCHLLRRWYETVFVMVYPRQARMHAIAYLFGLRCVPGASFVAMICFFTMCWDSTASDCGPAAPHAFECLE